MDEHTQHTTHDHSQHEIKDHSMYHMEDHSMHGDAQGHDMTGLSSKDHAAHAGHGTDHTGHEQMFRTRFCCSLLLSIPVLLYSEMIQMWLGFAPPTFPFSEWISFIFSVIVFTYGVIPLTIQVNLD